MPYTPARRDSPPVRSLTVRVLTTRDIPSGWGPPPRYHSPEGAGSAGSTVGGLSPLSFAGSEERASLRDDVRRGVDEATTPRASPALVA